MRTAEHNLKISRALRGKNRYPRSLEHRASIAATLLVPQRGTPAWFRAYRERLTRLRAAERLERLFPPGMTGSTA